MSESENSQPQNDSDEDIYKDIPEFNFEDELAKLEGSKETYKQEASDLSEKVKALTEENKELKKSNEVLKKNLSTLLKTAQAEVQRKDSMIDGLRTQVDSITLRRNKTQTKDKYTSTDDLMIYSEKNCELNKQKHCSNKKRSRSFENCTSSDREQKSNQENEKRKEFSTRKENSGCDNIKKSSDYRDTSRTSSRHSGSNCNSQDETQKERKCRYEDSSSYRRSYRTNHRNHLKYDSYDKKRHSRSSDRRFVPSRKSIRERWNNHKMEESSERKRSRESSVTSKKSYSKRRKSHSRGSQESSPERLKTKSCSSKDSSSRIKEQNNIKSVISLSEKNSTEKADNKRRNDIEKQTAVEQEGLTNIKKEQSKEKRYNKQEKRNDLDLFSRKSPLDALYNDMITTRSTPRFSHPKSVADFHESDIEEGELPEDKLEKEPQSSEEDWTLSFKNERPNETKPMTLYSMRMMRKFSSDPKTAEKLETESQNALKVEKTVIEKEPGELTDDENIVESSKEFQELTKVASIESEKSVKEKTFKEPLRRDFRMENTKPESIENQMVMEKVQSGRDELNVCKESEQIYKESREVIEFSPFKNNYKLIEISPVKPKSREHVLDFYNKKAPQPIVPNVPIQSEEEKSCNKLSDTSEGKESWKNSSSDKDSDMELKIAIPSVCENLNEKLETKEEEKTKKSKKRTDDKKLNNSEEESALEIGKQRLTERQEIAKVVLNDKKQKRKRKFSKPEEENLESKKPKIEKSEPCRKSKRTKRNSKSELEDKPDPNPEPEAKLESESEKKLKEDISSFEFFKPFAKAETLQTSVESERAVNTSTDYKMTASMSVTGVVRLETPNKCVEKLKNLMINEQMIFNVLDPKNNSQFSPLLGSKSIEMTPRRMLKNDLMLTDSEDDSIIKKNNTESDELDQEDVEEEEDQMSGFENSDCGSDSGASDFVDLL